jgi:hypothetical protein
VTPGIPTNCVQPEFDGVGGKNFAHICPIIDDLFSPDQQLGGISRGHGAVAIAGGSGDPKPFGAPINQLRTRDPVSLMPALPNAGIKPPLSVPPWKCSGCRIGGIRSAAC